MATKSGPALLDWPCVEPSKMGSLLGIAPWFTPRNPIISYKIVFDPYLEPINGQ